MNGQWGWHHAAKNCGLSRCHVGQSESQVGLSGCMVDHHSLLFPRGPCVPASISYNLRELHKLYKYYWNYNFIKGFARIHPLVIIKV